MTVSHEGGCVCGAVRYRVKAQPQAGLVCHCTWCQRRSGSAFAFVAYFNEADVEFLRGPHDRVRAPLGRDGAAG